MGKETASFISQLDATWPLVGDPVNQGDDHLRLLKDVLQTQFPNFTAAAANMTVTELNLLVGLIATATDLNKTQVATWEAGATADQTDAEIRAAVEAATDSNVFADADHTKLNGIEASATADQSNAEIRTAVEAATDSNVFTDADHSKLNGIEAGANITDTANVTSAGALMDSEVDADIKTLSLPASTTISAFIRTLLDDAAASNARTTLGVDAAGTDNSATHTGHVTGDTALTLVVAAITGQTLMGSALVDGDELLISDGGVIKRSVFSRIYTYIAAKMVAVVHTWAAAQTFSEIIASAKGISFPATWVPSTNANTLDDYKENVKLDCTMNASLGDITISSSWDSIAYTRIGRMIHVQGELHVSSISGGQSGNWSIYCLPTEYEPLNLTQGQDEIYFPVLVMGFVGGPANGWHTGYISQGRTFIQILDGTDNSSTAANVSATTEVYLDFWYVSGPV